MPLRDLWLGASLLLILVGLASGQGTLAVMGVLLLLAGGAARIWQRLALERAFDKPVGCLGDLHGSRLGGLLHAGGKVDGIAERGVFARQFAADFADDDDAGVEADAHVEVQTVIARDLRAEGVDIADDLETGQFFMRVSFTSQQGKSLDELKAGFGETAKKFSMNFDFHDESRKMKVIIMVSRFGHCLNDLLYRWRIGALPIDIVAVISNHMDYQKVVVNHDIPYYCIKVTKENKPQAEAEQMRIV